MKKDILIPFIIFIVIFVLFISIYFILFNKNKYNYSCYDYENNMTYTFKTEEEMHEVCDKLNGTEEDQIMSSYTIYNDLINVDEEEYAFYPYINSDKNLSIIITILDCENPNTAKEKAIKWFSNHSYNMNDYTIEYEYPCDN